MPTQNRIPNQPQLADLLNFFKKEIMLGLNCHHIAKIQSFDPLTQTATATINYQKTYLVPNPVTGVYGNKLESYAVLTSCPVISIGGGGAALTFPITTGDDCIVFFNDRDLDNWFQGSSTSANATGRLHSFSDGIILVGLRALPDVLLNYSSDEIQLRTKSGLTNFAVAKDGSYVSGKAGLAMEFKFNSDGTFTITNANGEFLQSLINMLTLAYTVTVLGNQPLVFPPTDLAIVESFL